MAPTPAPPRSWFGKTALRQAYCSNSSATSALLWLRRVLLRSVAARCHALSDASPVVLNLANAFRAGGGFRTGAAAQEENLHRRTDLFQVR